MPRRAAALMQTHAGGVVAITLVSLWRGRTGLPTKRRDSRNPKPKAKYAAVEILILKPYTGADDDRTAKDALSPARGVPRRMASAPGSPPGRGAAPPRSVMSPGQNRRAEQNKCVACPARNLDAKPTTKTPGFTAVCDSQSTRPTRLWFSLFPAF